MPIKSSEPAPVVNSMTDWKNCIEASQAGACRERDIRKIRELLSHDPSLAEALAERLDEAAADTKRKK